MSTGLWILFGVLAFLLLLLLLPIRIRVRWDGAMTLWGGIGPVRVRVFPRASYKKPKKQKPPKKATPKKESKPPPEPKPEAGMTLDKLREYLEFGKNALKRLRGLIRVPFFKLHVVFGGSNPMATALSFGGASAAISTIYPILEDFFRVRNTDIFVDTDFHGRGSWLLESEVRTTPIVAIAAALKIGLAFLKLKKQQDQDAQNKPIIQQEESHEQRI